MVIFGHNKKVKCLMNMHYISENDRTSVSARHKPAMRGCTYLGAAATGL